MTSISAASTIVTIFFIVVFSFLNSNTSIVFFDDGKIIPPLKRFVNTFLKENSKYFDFFYFLPVLFIFTAYLCKIGGFSTNIHGLAAKKPFEGRQND